ncbi:unnamed protein product [Rhizoctonia solani]|uniref:Glycoside hydrolase family 31 TIM barrel domain-containing protein n=1 Tax=Rhizoctonia solani TaxID=456999 RepID=A0A8H2X3K2_9AGAM|nr:unnamed protein product [Rhizoctonia solani]
MWANMRYVLGQFDSKKNTRPPNDGAGLCWTRPRNTVRSLDTADGYFIKDKRHIAEGGPSNAYEDRYMVYHSSNRDEWTTADPNQEPNNKYTPPDTQPLSDTWNTGKPFRGGVHYGADLAFPPFRLLITSDEHKGSDSRDAAEAELPATQVWALYSLNLHKATYHGWDHNASRTGRRNFIIGRGGFIGLHRYAGLWTGDNASTWDFLRVSVARVVSLGLSSITISGGDVGGFEPGRDNGKWASPELLMRWYLAYCLLLWFRNHYNRKMDKKEFQESYRFIDKINQAPSDQQWMYRATMPWWQFNLRADEPDAAAPLGGRFDGGTLMPYDARMSDNMSQIPYMNPMFIRYGAIIPQIEPRLYAEDWAKPNPIAIHVYPGRIGFRKAYDMYLDDGVSRESAETADNLQKHLVDNEAFNTGERSKVIRSPLKPSEFGDDQAGNVFWRVRILQETLAPSGQVHRNIYLETLDYNVKFDPTKQHGSIYRVFIWGAPDLKDKIRSADLKVFSLQDLNNPVEKQVAKNYDARKNAWIVELNINEVQRAKHKVQLPF